jgi:hypothetical protein
MRKAALVLGPLVLSLLALVVLLWSLGVVPIAGATPPQALSITATKPTGQFPGTWSASGVIADAGTFHTLDIHFSAAGAPDFQITHVTFEFDSPRGTFSLEAQIKETLTADPNILTDEGNWVIRDGTGAYAGLHGQGGIVGTVNEHINVIDRTFSGNAQID